MFFQLIFSSPLFAQTYTKAQVLLDFKELDQYIRYQHPGFEYYCSKEKYEAICDSIVKAMPEKMNSFEAYNLLLPVVNSVLCGHSSLRVSDAEKKKIKNFPFYIKAFDNKYYVHCNLTCDSLFERGSVIIAVNDIPITDAITRLSFIKNNGIDNLNSVARYNKAINNIERMHYILFGLRDTVQIKFVSVRDGKTYTKKYNTITPIEEAKIYKSKYAFENSGLKNLTLSIPDSLKKSIAVIEVSSFSNNGLDLFGFKYRRRLKNDFKKIKDLKIDKLIIDLRGDGGGRIGNADYLMTFLAKEKFNLTSKVLIKKKAFKVMPFPLNIIFRRVLFKKQDSVFYTQSKIGKLKPQKKYHYDGETVLLLNSGSYSATTLFASVVKDKGLAKVIGDAPGGANQITFAGFFEFIKLKNTKMIARFPILRIYQDVSNQQPYISVDIPVDRSLKDLFKNTDPAMAKAIEYFKQQKLGTLK